MDNKTFTDINIENLSRKPKTPSSSEKPPSVGKKNLFYLVLTGLIGISLIVGFVIFSKNTPTPKVSKISTDKVKLNTRVTTTITKTLLNSADLEGKNIFDKSTFDPSKQITQTPPRDPYAPTITPTPVKKQIQKSKPVALAQKPTTSVKKPSPTPTLSATPTMKPTSTPVKPSVTPTKAVQKVTPTVQKPSNQAQKSYVVKRGDSLWKISEQNYGTGFYASELAKSNKIANAGLIYAGQKLILPEFAKVSSEKKTVAKAPVDVKITPKSQTKSNNNQDILSANTTKTDTVQKYTVVSGDNLWNISVKFYGNGFEWKKIAEANKLSNPRVIHKGNILTIPAKNSK